MRGLSLAWAVLTYGQPGLCVLTVETAIFPFPGSRSGSYDSSEKEAQKRLAALKRDSGPPPNWHGPGEEDR